MIQLISLLSKRLLKTISNIKYSVNNCDLFNRNIVVIICPLIATNHLFDSKSSRFQHLRQESVFRSAHSMPATTPQKPFTNQWFAPFVTIKKGFRYSKPELYSEEPMSHLGSGIIVSRRGYVLTTSTKVIAFSRVLVCLGDGRRVTGKVVTNVFGPQIRRFTAIKLEGNETDRWPMVTYANPATLQVDDTVYSVVNAKYGLLNQLTAGVICDQKVSGKEIDEIKAEYFASFTYIQHSAPVVYRDIGAALVNSEGHVVAVNIIQHSLTDNFALPVNSGLYAMIMKDIDLFLAKMAQQTDISLGLVVYWLDNEFRDKLAKDVNYSNHTIPTTDGIIICWMSPEFQSLCTANNINLKPFDVIMAINGAKVDSMDPFYEAMDALKCGQRVWFKMSDGSDVGLETTDAVLKALIKRKIYFM